MSKTTNALVALGVVAGLGVAALPFSAMAATDNEGVTIFDGAGTPNDTTKYDGTADKTVTDTVVVRTQIKDTLSLTIAGDDDATGEEGINHLVLLGDDGTIKNGASAEGAATVTVATNNKGGYQVKMNGEATGFDGQNTGDKFAPVTTEAAGLAEFPTSGPSVFGYKTTKATTGVDNVSLINGNWNGVPTTATKIATGAAATKEAGDAFTITFKAYANESQAADTYDELVTITATTNLSTDAGA